MTTTCVSCGRVYWSYVHSVYSGLRGSIVVRRYCGACGAEQVGLVGKWREPRQGEFDDTAAEAAKEKP